MASMNSDCGEGEPIIELGSVSTFYVKIWRRSSRSPVAYCAMIIALVVAVIDIRGLYVGRRKK